MNKIAFCAALIALSAGSMGHGAHAKPAKKQTAKTQAKVNWQPSYWAARKAARRSGKPMFIDFYTDWCGPCKHLEQTTFRNAKFVAYSRGWIMVRVNPEKSALGRQLAERYGVQGFPTMIFTDGGGVPHGQAFYDYPASELLPMMKRAAKKANGLRA